MKKQFRAILCFLCCGVLVLLLTNAAYFRTAAAEALSLCAGSVIPSLFPFLVISNLLLSLGFASWISPLLSGLMTPLFGLPGSAGSALILGFIGGYPLGIRTAVSLYQNKLLTHNETQQLLYFCNNSNPAFLISVLGIGVFNSTRIGLWLWLIHLLSAMLTGILFRGKTRTSNRISFKNHTPLTSFSTTFVTAVGNASTGILSVCSFVLLFYVLVSPFRMLPLPLASFLAGITELFSLIPLLTNTPFGFVLAAGASGWGGLSVLAQTAAVLAGSDLSLRPCIYGKLTQGILSVIFAAISVPLLF